MRRFLQYQLRLLVLAAALVLSLASVEASNILARGFGGTASPNVPVPVGNIYPPTVPISIAPVAEVGQITFRAWQSVSPTDGINLGPGVTQYDVELDGAVQSPLTTGSSNAQGDFTLGEISAISADPVLTRVNGVEFDLTSGGGGTESAGGFNNVNTDRLAFAYRPWSSGQVVSVDVDSLTASDCTVYPADYDGTGPMVRSSLAANAAFVAIDHRCNAGSKMIFVLWRTTDGVARQTPIYAFGNGSFGHLHIEDAGSCSWRMWSQADGGALVLQTTVTGTCITSGYWGVFANSLTSQIATARLKQVAARSTTPVAYIVSGTSSHTVRFRSRDANGNVSAWSVPQTGAGLVDPPPPDTYVKWHPGHYIQQDVLLLNSNASSIHAATWIANENNFKGESIRIPWGTLQSADGVYNFAAVRTLRDYLNNTTTPGTFSQPKRLILDPWYMRYSSNLPSTTDYIPTYIANSGCMKPGLYGAGSGYYADMNDAFCRGEFIQLLQALCAEFDADPWIEAIAVTETAFPITEANQRLLAAGVKNACPHTNTVTLHNWLLNPGSDDRAFSDYSVSIHHGTGGPDVLLDPPNGPCQSHGQLAFAGAGVTFSPCYNQTFNFGLTDNRGKVPNILHKQVDWSPYATPAQMITYAAGQKVTHLVHAATSVSTHSYYNWADAAGPRAAVNANPNTLFMSCPSSYAGTCRTN